MNVRIKRLFQYLLDRRGEWTSWVGYVIAIGAATGRTFSPEIVSTALALLAALASVALYVYPEMKE